MASGLTCMSAVSRPNVASAGNVRCLDGCDEGKLCEGKLSCTVWGELRHEAVYRTVMTDGDVRA